MIRFGELVGLMVLGTGSPDRLRGVVEHRSPDGDWTQRVFRRGEMVRREAMDGRVLEIIGEDTQWMRYKGDVLFTAMSREGSFVSPIGGLDVGGERGSFSRWDGTDFTRPAGPVISAEFLGRPAWAVELRPPSHKPSPMQLVVDARSGLVLRAGNVDFGWSTEWTALDFDADLPDELFVWDGPTKPHGAAAERARQVDLSDRRAWLADRGLESLSMVVDAELQLHSWTDDGTFELSFDGSADGALMRRPAGDGAWPQADGQRWPQIYRWTDEHWDWLLASQHEIDRDRLADLKSRLASTT